MLPLTKLPVSAHPYDWEGAVPKRRPHTRALALAGATLILVLQFVDWLTGSFIGSWLRLLTASFQAKGSRCSQQPVARRSGSRRSASTPAFRAG